MRPAFDLGFYLVLDPVLCGGTAGMVETATAAVAGGASMVQLRDKDADTARMTEMARALRQALAGSGVPLIVNDDVEAALASGAEGLHIGQDDMPAAAARARIGTGMILGLSAETGALAAAIDPHVVDYAGLGPVFATPTKPGHKPAVGLDGLAALVAACPVPAVAIGGLKAEHADAVFGCGAKGLAVVSAVCGQVSPLTAARAIAAAIERARP